MTATVPMLVAGGGPAGAALATALARAGREVLLLERSDAAHDKVCGEFLSGGALDALHALGIDAWALGAVPVGRVRLSCGGKVVESALPFAAAGLSRRALDEALLARATAAGATVRRGVAVRGIGAGAGALLVRTEAGEMAASRVALATGKYELRGMRRRAGRVDPPWTGLKLHLRLPPGVATDRIDVEVFPGGYGGLQPVEGGRVTLCLAGRGRRFAGAGRSWTALRALLAERAPGLFALTAAAEPCWARPLAISGVPYGFLHRPGARDLPGLLRLGDQFGVIPSFCGDGIAIALGSGIAAAGAVLGQGDAATLHRALRRRLVRPFRVAGLLGAAARGGAGRLMALAAARRVPALIALVASLTRAPPLA